jgi:hypothetical protein
MREAHIHLRLHRQNSIERSSEYKRYFQYVSSVLRSLNYFDFIQLNIRNNERSGTSYI